MRGSTVLTLTLHQFGTKAESIIALHGRGHPTQLMEKIYERDDDVWFEPRVGYLLDHRVEQMIEELTALFTRMMGNINQGRTSESEGDDVMEDDNGYSADIA